TALTRSVYLEPHQTAVFTSQPGINIDLLGHWWRSPPPIPVINTSFSLRFLSAEVKSFRLQPVGGAASRSPRLQLAVKRTDRDGSRAGGRLYRRSSGGSVAPPSGQADAVLERDGHRLLRCAQDGDLRALKELLDRGCDVNFRDGFYWTPLMCASHAGQREAVRLLLNRGAAWVGVVDTQGRDARSLALQAGHQDVVTELERFGLAENSLTPDDITPRLGLKASLSVSDCSVLNLLSSLDVISQNKISQK
uniref:Uncharacterized protein n=1 Tax=Pygocentrus nattereri TaxID=42514 RepID=A0A3B4C936_PYGNA